MSQQGSVTVIMAAVVALVVALAIGLGVAGQLLVAWSRAATAADAAALAAAPATFGGSPLREATRLAAANGARLLWCHCPTDQTFAARTVAVRTEIRVDLPVLGSLGVGATGRAEFDPIAGLRVPIPPSG